MRTKALCSSVVNAWSGASAGTPEQAGCRLRRRFRTSVVKLHCSDGAVAILGPERAPLVVPDLLTQRVLALDCVAVVDRETVTLRQHRPGGTTVVSQGQQPGRERMPVTGDRSEARISEAADQVVTE